MWRFLWCLGTVLLVIHRIEGKPCPQELVEVSHSTLECKKLTDVTWEIVNETRQVDEVREVCPETNTTSRSVQRLRTTDLECRNETVKVDKLVQLNVTHYSYTTKCSLTCNTGYSFSEESSGDSLSQTCNNDTGLWSHQTADNYFAKWWDVCTKRDNPQNRTTTTVVYLEPTETTININSTWTCPTQAEINTAMVVFYEEQTNIILCIGRKTCEQVDDMTKCEVALADGTNIKRSALKLTLVHKLTANLTDTVTMKTLSRALGYVISEGEFTLTITQSSSSSRRKRAATTVSYKANEVNYSSEVKFFCLPGFGMIGDFCSQCPKGYYLNESGTDNVCERCPLGTYTDVEGALTCTHCANSLTTFLDRSISASDCISKCTIKKSNNGTSEPEVGWSVTSSTIVQIDCKAGHSVVYGTNPWYKCNETAPQCYAKCRLDPVPNDVMLLPNDTSNTVIEHGNTTVVACVDFIHYHVVTCDDGALDWPQCGEIGFSLVGKRIYVLFIAVLVLGVVIFILVAITQAISKKKSSEFKGGNVASVQTNIENPLEKSIVSMPIEKEQFAKRVESFGRAGLKRWKTEFHLIPEDDPEQKRTIGLASYNRKKNKPGARGIVPYDISRVKLGQMDDEMADYYNASYVNGWRGPRMYIVAQTPLVHTRNEFWQLLFEQKTNIFVNLHPSGDVDYPTEYHKYWPEHNGLYGHILVKFESKHDYPGFTVRQFKVGLVELYDSDEESEQPDKEEKENEENNDNNEGTENEAGTLEMTVTSTTNLSAAEVERATTDDVADDATSKKFGTSSIKSSSVISDRTKSKFNGTTLTTLSVSGADDDKKSVLSSKTAKTSKSATSKTSKKTTSSYKMDLKFHHTSFIVKQMHFTGWNEDGQPDIDSFKNMVYFYRDITKFNTAKSPIIMHSEYGSDWASTFCGTDYVLDRLMSESDVNIAGLTNAMRQQRPMMIATVDQYIFMHKLIADILSREDFEEMKSDGFKVNAVKLLGEKDSTSASNSSGAENESGPMAALRSASRAVQSGARSVSQSVATATQSIFKRLSSGGGSSGLTSIKENSDV